MSATTSTNAPPPITEVEQHGIDTIPAEERTAKPIDLFRTIFGTSNAFSAVLLGSFPILVFGLSFEQAVLATFIGVVIGALIVMPIALFGPITGTNSAVASGAHFGVAGRIIGSLLAMLAAVLFYTLNIYISGDMVVFALDELAGTGRPKALLVIVYLAMAVVVLAIALYGYRFMMAVNKLNVPAGLLLYGMGVIALAGAFDAGATSGPSGAELTAPFIGAVLLIMANPISFGGFLGDWSRYIPAATPRRRMLGACFFGQLATAVPFLFGAATAVVITKDAAGFAESGDYVGGLVAVSPTWFLVPLCLLTVMGGLAGGSTALYGPGLDLSAIVTRLSRYQATALMGTLATLIVLVGAFFVGFVTLASTFVALILVCTTPWVVILTIGLVVRRAWYSANDLQVFNRGQRGGRYWFSGGYNWRALAAWAPAAVLGLLFVNLPGQFEGPLRDVIAADLGVTALAGVDLGLVVSIVASAVLFIGLLIAFPEPAHVYGPDGPRFLRANDTELAAVRGRRHVTGDQGEPAQLLDAVAPELAEP